MSGFLDMIKMLLNNPVSHGNVQNRSYEEMPQRGGDIGSGWGLGRSSLPIYDYVPKHRQKERTTQNSDADLESLLRRQRLLEQIPQESGPAQQQQDPAAIIAALTGGAPQRSRPIQSPMQQMQPSMPEEGMYEGPNRNIQDDSRARAMAFIQAQREAGMLD